MRFRFITFAFVLLLNLMVRAADAPKTITLPENLVLDGIPAVPADLPEQIGRYTEFRAALFQDWDPRRRETLILNRFADTNQVHRVAQPSGARLQLTFFPDRVESATTQPTVGDYFIFSKGSGGNEFNQNYRYNFADGKITLLTDGGSKNSDSVWSNKGDRVAYTSTRRNGADTDIYVESPTDPKSDKMLAEVKGGGWEVQDWSPDDKQLLVIEEISINESYLWLFDTQSGDRKELTPRPSEGGEKVSYSRARFAKDGKGIFVTTDRDSEFQRLAFVDLASGKHAFLIPDAKWDIEDWDLSADGARIAYVFNENGRSTLQVASVAIKENTMSITPHPDPVFDPPQPAAVITGLRWHRHDNVFAFNVAGARSPSDTYTWSLDAPKVTRWTESETGGIPKDQFVEPKLVTWKSIDGRQISGFLYLPNPQPFPGPRPVIANINGGPQTQFR